MNALAGNNARKSMIPIFAQTFNIRKLDAAELLNRVQRDTAIDISAEKLNCAEDCRVRWTTRGNLELWFNTWEQFVVEYGFATINVNGEVVFNEETTNYIIKEIQKKQDYQTTLQEDEYNLQMENYIKDILANTNNIFKDGMYVTPYTPLTKPNEKNCINGICNVTRKLTNNAINIDYLYHFISGYVKS
jgi:hypothetical protein